MTLFKSHTRASIWPPVWDAMWVLVFKQAVSSSQSSFLIMQRLRGSLTQGLGSSAPAAQVAHLD